MTEHIADGARGIFREAISQHTVVLWEVDRIRQTE